MTIILTPYWSDGVQKLKVAAQRTSMSLLCLSQLAEHFLYTAAPPPPRGLVPPVLDGDIHTIRCLAQLRSKTSDLEKYIYLSYLKSEDPRMFYKLCLEHMPEITPIIYTPTVGEACVKFSHIYRRPEGLVCIPHPSSMNR
jgi:malate dehydrogenase (oxaloacetate-decarboxylating)(NADP+)